MNRNYESKWRGINYLKLTDWDDVAILVTRFISKLASHTEGSYIVINELLIGMFNRTSQYYDYVVYGYL